MKNFIILRGKKFSFIYEKRSIAIIIVAFVLCAAAILLSLSFGQKIISVGRIIEVVFLGKKGGDALIINTIRMPRTLVALFVGASLGLSGAILQGVIKNPLADPNVVGIVDSGSVGALLFLTLFTDPKNNSLTVSVFYMPVFAFAGAITAVFLVYFMAYRKGVTPYRLILIGIAIAGAAKALTSILIINGPVVFIKDAQLWITGTIYGTNWTHVKLLGIWTIVLIIIALASIRELNVHSFEDNTVKGLGSKVERKRFFFMLLSAALASGAVAVGGGITFVGLMAPHIARKLTNSNFENMIPLSCFIGGMIVIIADLAARVLFYPLDLPVGIFTAGIGAPFFIYLMIKNRNSGKR
jgi:iron complex transport system permease protein